MNLVVNERSSLNNNNRTLGLLPDYAENENWSSYVEKMEFFSLQMKLKLRIKRKQFYLVVVELLLTAYLKV